MVNLDEIKSMRLLVKHSSATSIIHSQAKVITCLNHTICNIDNADAANRDATSYETEHVLASYIGRINYNFDEKYLLSATARRDGSSRFAKSNRWGWFPSVSAGWRIERENFFPVSKSTINLLKIRGSYGELGNENLIPLGPAGKPASSEYQYMDVMTRGNYTYSFANNKVTGSVIIKLCKHRHPMGNEENAGCWSRPQYV